MSLLVLNPEGIGRIERGLPQNCDSHCLVVSRQCKLHVRLFRDNFEEVAYVLSHWFPVIDYVYNYVRATNFRSSVRSLSPQLRPVIPNLMIIFFLIDVDIIDLSFSPSNLQTKDINFSTISLFQSHRTITSSIFILKCDFVNYSQKQQTSRLHPNNRKTETIRFKNKKQASRRPDRRNLLSFSFTVTEDDFHPTPPIRLFIDQLAYFQPIKRYKLSFFY